MSGRPSTTGVPDSAPTDHGSRIGSAPGDGYGLVRRRRATTGAGATVLALAAAVAGTSPSAATVILAVVGLTALVAALMCRRVGILAGALALLGGAYAAGLSPGIDVWAPLHGAAFLAAAELADRSMRPAITSRGVASFAAAAAATSGAALALATVDGHPGAVVRLGAIACAGAALTLAAGAVRRS